MALIEPQCITAASTSHASSFSDFFFFFKTVLRVRHLYVVWGQRTGGGCMYARGCGSAKIIDPQKEKDKKQGVRQLLRGGKREKPAALSSVQSLRVCADPRRGAYLSLFSTSLQILSSSSCSTSISSDMVALRCIERVMSVTSLECTECTLSKW